MDNIISQNTKSCNSAYTGEHTCANPRHDVIKTKALAYAKLGWHVIPLHEPIFDSAGTLTGCTCEDYKRSAKHKRWLESKGLAHKFDPNFKCRTPGKHPRLSDWEAEATTDPAKILAWLERWPTANIGIAVGRSGLVTLDLDAYKDTYDGGDLLTLADKDTITQISGGGGEHLIYAMPPGKAYGNDTGTLPTGVDIRGIGGMQVVEPSIHPTGKPYQWEDGYSPFERTPATLPAALQAILDDAHAKSTPASAAKFTTATTERPELIRWKISKATRDLIYTPAPVGQRSEADYSVCLSLAYAGASDDEILAVFQHYPVGTQGKYAERGDTYLALTIGQARAYVADHPRQDVSGTIDALRLFVRTHSFAAYIDPKFLASDGTYRTDSADTKTADAILDLMSEAQRLQITVGKKRLAKFAGLGSCNTAAAALDRLSGWLFDVTIDPEHGTQVSLDQCRLQQIDPLLCNPIVSIRDQFSANDKNDYSPHKASDPFLTGTSRFMRRQIQDVALALDITPAQAKAEYTHAGLGETCLRLIDALRRCGDMTALELAEETGKKVSSIRTALRKLEQHELASGEREGSRGPKVYTLEPDTWQKIGELAPSLRTHKLSDQREVKRLERAQINAQRGARQAEAPEQRQACERRFAKLAKQRLPLLQSLYPGLTPADCERLAYEVADYKRTPAQVAEIAAARAATRHQHRQEVKTIVGAIGQVLDAGTTKETVLQVVTGQGFDEGMTRHIMQSPRLMAKATTATSQAALAANIAQLKGEGLRWPEIKRHLAYAGFTQGEIRAALGQRV